MKINDYTNREAKLIPLSIISENAAGQQYVYAISGEVNKEKGTYGKAVQRLIAVGKTQGDRIEVLDGINVGDKIILEGARSVKNNQEVKIAHKDQKVK